MSKVSAGISTFLALPMLLSCSDFMTPRGSYRALLQCMKQNSAPGIESVRTLCAERHQVPLSNGASLLSGGADFVFASDSVLYEPAASSIDSVVAFSGQVKNTDLQTIITSFEIEISIFGVDTPDGLYLVRLPVHGVWVEPQQSHYFRIDDISDAKRLSRSELDLKDGSVAWSWTIKDVKGIQF